MQLSFVRAVVAVERVARLTAFPLRAYFEETDALSGQLVNIKCNLALFSLLGTNVGGDGKTTFGLPDLQGRVVVGTGIGNGGTRSVSIGERYGGDAYALQSAPLRSDVPDPPLVVPQGPAVVPEPTTVGLVAAGRMSWRLCSAHVRSHRLRI